MKLLKTLTTAAILLVSLNVNAVTVDVPDQWKTRANLFADTGDLYIEATTSLLQQGYDKNHRIAPEIMCDGSNLHVDIRTKFQLQDSNTPQSEKMLISIDGGSDQEVPIQNYKDYIYVGLYEKGATDMPWQKKTLDLVKQLMHGSYAYITIFSENHGKETFRITLKESNHAIKPVLKYCNIGL